METAHLECKIIQKANLYFLVDSGDCTPSARSNRTSARLPPPILRLHSLVHYVILFNEHSSLHSLMHLPAHFHPKIPLGACKIRFSIRCTFKCPFAQYASKTFWKFVGLSKLALVTPPTHPHTHQWQAQFFSPPNPVTLFSTSTGFSSCPNVQMLSSQGSTTLWKLSYLSGAKVKFAARHVPSIAAV